MFIAALFTIAKTWKIPICPSTKEWIQKTCNIPHTMEYYLAIKKNEIYNVICSNTNGPRYYHAKGSEKEKHIQHICISKSLLCTAEIRTTL